MSLLTTMKMSAFKALVLHPLRGSLKFERPEEAAEISGGKDARVKFSALSACFNC